MRNYIRSALSGKIASISQGGIPTVLYHCQNENRQYHLKAKYSAKSSMGCLTLVVKSFPIYLLAFEDEQSNCNKIYIYAYTCRFSLVAFVSSELSLVVLLRIYLNMEEGSRSIGLYRSAIYGALATIGIRSCACLYENYLFSSLWNTTVDKLLQKAS